MKSLMLGALMVAVVFSLSPTDADAKRVGGGNSSGMQRNMPARTAPDAAPGKPAAPAQAAPQQAAPANPAAAPGAAAAPAKRSWMGPLAGLAAGLGIAALMSHLGMGEAMGNFLMIALLAVAAFFVIRLIMRRFSPAPTPAAETAMPYAGQGNAGGAQVAWPAAGGAGAATTSPTATPLADAGVAAPQTAADAVPAAAVASAPVAKAFVPAVFDSEGVERVGKMIFIRMQAANDAGDLDDLRTFTTPEMFAVVKLDLQERGNAKQHTEVIHVDAKVLDVAQEGERQVVSVRFSGQLREEAGAAPVDFNEIWHLVKPVDDSRSWAIAGIEQA
jgi:predicted lipid-binding transport protein (Tim44 family)